VSGLSSNPFATRFIAPGRIAWVGDSDFFDRLESRWQALKCRAAIVGPHGSGKSTLLEHLVPRIGASVFRRDALGKRMGESIVEGAAGAGTRSADPKARQPTVWLQLRKTEPRSMVIPWHEICEGRLLVVDGYEQLNRWRRATLVTRTWRRGVALLVTSHRRTLLPTLCELSVTTDIARQIIARLTAERADLPQPSDEEISRRLRAQSGNLREVLMDLYDRVEERKQVRTEGT
jgi:hypothetical protein